MLKIIGITEVVEPDRGWLHELVVETDKGQALIRDDTDFVIIRATSPDALSVREAACLWTKHGMGCGHFLNEVPAKLRVGKKVWDLDAFPCLVWEGSGEDFSCLDLPRPDRLVDQGRTMGYGIPVANPCP